MSGVDASDVQTLLLSLKTAGVATVVAGAVGLAFSLLVAGRDFRGKSLLDALLLAPLVLPPTVVGYLLLVGLGAQSPVGRLMVEWFGETLIFTWPAAVLASAVVAMPLMYRTCRGALEQNDPTLTAAARTLGAGGWRIVRRIAVPLARPGILAGLVLAFARAFGEFGATLMIAGNLPGRTRTVPLAIYTDVESGDMAHAGVWVAVTLVLTLVLAWLANVVAAARPRAKSPVVGIAEAPRARAVPASPEAAVARTPLAARVVKCLGDFTLDVDFGAAARPLAVLGPSGAGKSLLLRCLSGLARPDQGLIQLGDRILFDGALGVDVPTKDRRVGHLFQSYALFPHLTVQENVAFGASPAAAQRWLEDLDLTPLADRLPGEISGGQAQRVALARALATEPDLLLLDEPLAALDTHLRSRVEHRLAATIAKYRGAVLMVTHNLDEAFRLCDDLVVLAGGRVIAQGPKQSVLDAPGSVTAALLTGCKNVVAVKRAGAFFDVPEWGVRLPATADATHVGCRAHHVRVERGVDLDDTDDTYAAALVATSETPHRMTMLFSLGGPVPLQVEVFKDAWERLRLVDGPWRVTLPRRRLLTLRGDA